MQGGADVPVPFSLLPRDYLILRRDRSPPSAGGSNFPQDTTSSTFHPAGNGASPTNAQEGGAASDMGGTTGAGYVRAGGASPSNQMVPTEPGLAPQDFKTSPVSGMPVLDGLPGQELMEGSSSVTCVALGNATWTKGILADLKTCGGMASTPTQPGCQAGSPLFDDGETWATDSTQLRATSPDLFTRPDGSTWSVPRPGDDSILHWATIGPAAALDDTHQEDFAGLLTVNLLDSPLESPPAA